MHLDTKETIKDVNYMEELQVFLASRAKKPYKCTTLAEYLNHVTFKPSSMTCWFYASKSLRDVAHAYPVGHWRMKQVLVRPEVYKLYKGQIPEGKRVNVSCGHKGCINPEHFVLDDYGNPEIDTPQKKFMLCITKTGPNENDCWHINNRNIRYEPIVTLKDEHTPAGKKYSLYKGQQLSYEHFIGPIPKYHWVKQTCGNKGCVNPKHLYLTVGKYDKIKTKTNTVPSAEEMQQIVDLYAQGVSFTQLSKAYKYSAHSLSLILQYITKNGLWL